MLLEIRDGSVSPGGTPVLTHFNFEIRGTEKIAVVGRNGAGKSTLLKVLTGEISLDANEKNPSSGMYTSRSFTLAALEQQSTEDLRQTAEESFLSAILSGKPEEFRYSDERYLLEQQYRSMFTRLGFSPEELRKRLSEFSGGEQTKLRLIRLLLAEPDVLILDEPTNHLDLETVEWLEQYLRSYPKAVVTVSHDRYFIDRTADVIWEVSGGKMTRFPGNYTRYRAEKTALYRRQKKAWEDQQEEITRLNGLIDRFKHKPTRAAFARSRKTMLERMEKIEKPEADDAVIRTGDLLPLRSGSRQVYECEHLKFGYARSLKEISFRLKRGQKIGIIGPNGTGKTAFLKTVAGLLPPFTGKQSLGVNVDAAYFDQLSAQDLGKDAAENVSVIDWFRSRWPGLKDREIRETLAGYLFRGTDLGKKVGSLSGGEKARLVLASLLQAGPNFLILDEPTNNMDIPAKETLESIFRSYKGTILFVSHDRYFVNRVAEALLVFEPDAEQVMFYPFNYEHYRERREQSRSGADPAALRTAEEQRLIDGLKAVPEAEHHRLRELSTEEAERDWRFSLNRRERTAAEASFRAAAAALEAVPESEAEYEVFLSGAVERTAALERARDAWTACCLAWYDLWTEERE